MLFAGQRLHSAGPHLALLGAAAAQRLPLLVRLLDHLRRDVGVEALLVEACAADESVLEPKLQRQKQGHEHGEQAQHRRQEQASTNTSAIQNRQPLAQSGAQQPGLTSRKEREDGEAHRMR